MRLPASLGIAAAFNRRNPLFAQVSQHTRKFSVKAGPDKPSVHPQLHSSAQPPGTRQLSAFDRLLDPFMGVNISSVVGGIAAVPALAAWLLQGSLPLPLSLVLWHTAGAGLLVAAAASEPLAVHSTSLMGKRADGTIAPLAFALMWPYHVGLRAKLAMQRSLSTEPSYDQITEHYFIGAWPSEEKLVPIVHPAVLDVTCELPLQLVPPAYINLPVWDTHAPTPAQIEKGVQWALQQVAAGRPVLVHCAHGHGRSATVLAAILIAEGTSKGPAEAEALMKSHRPRVRLNGRQKEALVQWVAMREGGKQE